MKRPATIKEFKELINNMQHRERFVFDLADDQPVNECNAFMEVYSTELSADMLGRKQNILFQTVGYGGDYNPKFNFKKNKLFRIMPESMISKVYSMIK